LLPTAETHPQGTFYLSSYEILILQAGYAFTDRMQFSLSIIPVVFQKDPIVPVDLSLKAVLSRSGRVRLAAMASATGLLGFEQGEAFVGRFGGVTELCIDEACRSSVNVAANLMLAGPALLLANGAGAILRTSDLFAFLVELQSIVPVGREVADVHALGGAGGVRLSGARWAVDLALEAPLDRRGNLPKALPWIAATYRFLP